MIFPNWLLTWPSTLLPIGHCFTSYWAFSEPRRMPLEHWYTKKWNLYLLVFHHTFILIWSSLKRTRQQIQEMKEFQTTAGSKVDFVWPLFNSLSTNYFFTWTCNISKAAKMPKTQICILWSHRKQKETDLSIGRNHLEPTHNTVLTLVRLKVTKHICTMKTLMNSACYYNFDLLSGSRTTSKWRQQECLLAPSMTLLHRSSWKKLTWILHRLWDLV